MLPGIRLLQQHPQPVLHIFCAAQKGEHNSGPGLSLKDAWLQEPVALGKRSWRYANSQDKEFLCPCLGPRREPR